MRTKKNDACLVLGLQTLHPDLTLKSLAMQDFIYLYLYDNIRVYIRIDLGL